MTNIGINLEYCIDSWKLNIDEHLFDSVNIPTEYVLTDRLTGEIIDDNFKRTTLPTPYKNDHFYLARIVKKLPHATYRRVQILFSAKITDDYFSGIKLKDVIDLIEYCKEKGILVYKDINKILDNIIWLDMDIKKDIICEWNFKDEIAEFFKEQASQYFNGFPNDVKVFNNQKRGLGLETYKRELATPAKPFLKFYDKSTEILRDKNIKTYNSLKPNTIETLTKNLVIRYEYTIKDKRFCEKFGISNKIMDLFKIPQSKWEQIGGEYLRINFEPRLKQVRDYSKVTPTDMTLCLMFKTLLNEGVSLYQIKMRFVRETDNRLVKNRQRKLFDKIHALSNGTGEKSKEVTDKFNRMNRWSSIFGF